MRIESTISDANALRSHFWKLPHFLKAIQMSVERAIETASVFDFLAHPSCLVVEDPKFETVKLVCKLADAAGERASVVDLDVISEELVAPLPKK